MKNVDEYKKVEIPLKVIPKPKPVEFSPDKTEHKNTGKDKTSVPLPETPVKKFPNNADYTKNNE